MPPTIPIIKGSKRKAETSSPPPQDKVKRSVLGNLSNAVAKEPLKDIGNIRRNNASVVAPIPEKKRLTATSNAKQQTLVPKHEYVKVLEPSLTVPTNEKSANAFITDDKPKMVPRPTKVMTRASARASQSKPPLMDDTVTKTAKVVCRRLSTFLQKSLDNTSSLSSIDKPGQSSDVKTMYESNAVDYIENQFSVVPAGIVDFDKENWDDPFQVSNYAMDIFNYLKSREEQFKVRDYINDQLHLTKGMRSRLVDWMVEIQELFELNHETLYLAVKIVDLYLGKSIVAKDQFQLVGAAALFIACKYDELSTPAIEDFLNVCNDAYTERELYLMEMNVIKIIDYDLGIPLSYRFLRRYARCGKIPMYILTLARYILEFSLMNYETITFSDSKMASAALYMALRMYKKSSWNKTLEYYTGYELKHFANIVVILNAGLHQKPSDSIETVRNKYSHKIFYEVAKVKLLSTEALFEGTGISDVRNGANIKV